MNARRFAGPARQRPRTVTTIIVLTAAAAQSPGVRDGRVGWTAEARRLYIRIVQRQGRFETRYRYCLLLLLLLL